ncbi:unnamed protein product [Acanthoscelides obtectus]|uniref:Uncharacterized protein n=1 Tax=Acanthoscelides obtectus TaxID=200917 RepID=A0A9P0PGQ4_ACAOB|nr:unnamed protein product [Acanthoscelides obtectus]CAK1662986.1 hypothetical protein AOBTE_LOCUS23413 [Acanthoscelides obtectus]
MQSVSALPHDLTNGHVSNIRHIVWERFKSYKHIALYAVIGLSPFAILV